MRIQDTRDEMAALHPVLLYLHIPKAAGTTMASLLPDAMRCRSDHDPEIHGFHAGVFYHPAGFIRELDAASESIVQQALGRGDLRAVMGHFRFGLHEALSRPCRYVTMLREPVSRIRSLYHFQRLNESRHGALAGVRLPDGVNLAGYVCQPPYAEVDNGMTRRISGMSPPIGGCTGAMLELAKRNLQAHFCVVGLSERFDETIVLMAHRLEWKETPLYYPKNVNSCAEGAVLDRDLAELIRLRNSLDVELYHFGAELFTQSIAHTGAEFAQRLREYRARKHAWYRKHNLAFDAGCGPDRTHRS